MNPAACCSIVNVCTVGKTGNGGAGGGSRRPYGVAQTSRNRNRTARADYAAVNWSTQAMRSRIQSVFKQIILTRERDG